MNTECCLQYSFKYLQFKICTFVMFCTSSLIFFYLFFFFSCCCCVLCYRKSTKKHFTYTQSKSRNHWFRFSFQPIHIHRYWSVFTHITNESEYVYWFNQVEKLAKVINMKLYFIMLKHAITLKRKKRHKINFLLKNLDVVDSSTDFNGFACISNFWQETLHPKSKELTLV